LAGVTLCKSVPDTAEKIEGLPIRVVVLLLVGLECGLGPIDVAAGTSVGGLEVVLHGIDEVSDRLAGRGDGGVPEVPSEELVFGPTDGAVKSEAAHAGAWGRGIDARDPRSGMAGGTAVILPLGKAEEQLPAGAREPLVVVRPQATPRVRPEQSVGLHFDVGGEQPTAAADVRPRGLPVGRLICRVQRVAGLLIVGLQSLRCGEQAAAVTVVAEHRPRRPGGLQGIQPIEANHPVSVVALNLHPPYAVGTGPLLAALLRSELRHHHHGRRGRSAGDEAQDGQEGKDPEPRPSEGIERLSPTAVLERERDWPEAVGRFGNGSNERHRWPSEAKETGSALHLLAGQLRCRNLSRRTVMRQPGEKED